MSRVPARWENELTPRSRATGSMTTAETHSVTAAPQAPATSARASDESRVAADRASLGGAPAMEGRRIRSLRSHSKGRVNDHQSTDHEQPLDESPDASRDRAKGAEDDALVKADGELCERRGGPELLETTLETLELTLYSRQLVLDRDDVADRGRAGEQVAQAIAAGSECPQPSFDVDRFLAHVARRRRSARDCAETREGVHGRVELRFRHAQGEVGGAILMLLTLDVAAGADDERMGAGNRWRDLVDVEPEGSAPDQHRGRRNLARGRRQLHGDPRRAGLPAGRAWPRGPAAEHP